MFYLDDIFEKEGMFWATVTQFYNKNGYANSICMGRIIPILLSSLKKTSFLHQKKKKNNENTEPHISFCHC